MALVECGDCSREISDAAPACPHCGRPAELDRTRGREPQVTDSRRAEAGRKGLSGGAHVLHGLLSIGTQGFWIPLWVLHWLGRRFGGGIALLVLAVIASAGIVQYQSLSPEQKHEIAEKRKARETARRAEREASHTPRTAPTKAASACRFGRRSSGVFEVVGRNVQLRSGPGTQFDAVVNEKASGAMRRVVHATLDRSVELQRLCESDGWSEVESLGRLERRGWVPTALLQDPNAAYSPADLYLDEMDEQYRTQLAAAITGIERSNPTCLRANPGSVTRSSHRGTPREPVWFVTCSDSNDRVFNVWFSKGDLP